MKLRDLGGAQRAAEAAASGSVSDSSDASEPSQASSSSASSASSPSQHGAPRAGTAGPGGGAAQSSSKRQKRQVQQRSKSNPPTSRRGIVKRGHGLACKQCRISRLACDYRLPCSRCFKLCLPCQPQVLKVGPHKADSGGAAALAARGRERSGDGRGGSTSSRKRQRTAAPNADGGCSQGDGASDQEEEGNAGVLLQLAFSRMDPAPIVETMCQVFMELHGTGAIVHEKILPILRSFWLRSRRMGVDLSRGYVDLVARTLGVSHQLEDPASLALDFAPGGDTQIRTAHLDQLLARVGANTRGLLESDLFRKADDGCTALYAGITDDDGYWVEASNAAFASRFRSVPEIYEDVRTHRVHGVVLFASLIAPEDRATYLRAVAEVSSTHRKEKLTTFIKAFDRAGEVQLFIMEAWPVRTGRRGANNNGMLVRFSPCPQSRHISPRPGHMRIATTFQDPNAGCSSVSCGSNSSGSGSCKVNGHHSHGLRAVPGLCPPPRKRAAAASPSLSWRGGQPLSLRSSSPSPLALAAASDPLACVPAVAVVPLAMGRPLGPQPPKQPERRQQQQELEEKEQQRQQQQEEKEQRGPQANASANAAALFNLGGGKPPAPASPGPPPSCSASSSSSASDDDYVEDDDDEEEQREDAAARAPAPAAAKDASPAPAPAAVAAPAVAQGQKAAAAAAAATVMPKREEKEGEGPNEAEDWDRLVSSLFAGDAGDVATLLGESMPF